MKKAFLAFLLVALLFASSGCNVSQGSSSPPDERIYTFLGVTLGATKAEVAAVLGNPTDNIDDLYFYDYVGSDFHVARYNSENKAEWIATASDDFSLKGIGVGHSRNYVQDLIGEPDKIDTADTYYKWFYNTYGTGFCFYKSNDTCYGIGIYSGDK